MENKELGKEAQEAQETSTMLDQVSKTVSIDKDKVEALQKEMDELRKENSTKEYVVKMDAELLNYYDTFMMSQAPWRGKEALGILEISNKIREIKKEGIKNSVVYMTNLQIEATHYFLGKFESKGTHQAQEYVELFKAIETALGLVGADNMKVKDLEKDLHAAQQGLETC